VILDTVQVRLCGRVS